MLPQYRSMNPWRAAFVHYAVGAMSAWTLLIQIEEGHPSAWAFVPVIGPVTQALTQWQFDTFAFWTAILVVLVIGEWLLKKDLKPYGGRMVIAPPDLDGEYTWNGVEEPQRYLSEMQIARLETLLEYAEAAGGQAARSWTRRAFLEGVQTTEPWRYSDQPLGRLPELSGPR